MAAKESLKVVFLNVLLFTSSTIIGIFGSGLYFTDDDSLGFWGVVGSVAMDRDRVRVLSRALDEYYVRHCALPKDQSELVLFAGSQANFEFMEDDLVIEDLHEQPFEYNSWIEDGLAYYFISFAGLPSIGEEPIALKGPIVNDFPTNVDVSACRNRVGNFSIDTPPGRLGSLK